ncbi:MAG: chromosome segregation protein SMC [Sphingomonadales bacterium]
MPQSPDLFENKLELTPPAGASGPRLWVRRIAVWEEPGGKLIRDIPLRPGLNIIWSPDGAEADGGSIGHGAGKTLFCRLLRYCLGEARFADEEQRRNIGTAFPNGIVGAEVMVDDVCWAVVRPLGVRRRHVALQNGDLDVVAADDTPATGIDALVQAIEEAIITSEVAGLVRAQPGQPAWPIALAWLTRDQECRFDHILDWRDPSSGSEAPVPASGDNKALRVEAVRAFLRAITEEESQDRTTADNVKSEIAAKETQLGHLAWNVERKQSALISDLGLAGQSLPDMPLLIDVLRKEANAKLAEAAKLPDTGTTDIETAKKARDEARNAFDRLETEQKEINAQLPAEERLLTNLESEMPGLSSAAQMAASPVCPVCEVPIEEALAEGCKLSRNPFDEGACRARFEAKQREVAEQTETVGQLKARLDALKPEIALAQQAKDTALERLKRLEDVRNSRSDAWEVAQALQIKVEELNSAFEEKVSLRKALDALENQQRGIKDKFEVFRSNQAAVFTEVTGRFDSIVRNLLGPSANGEIKLTGKGVEPKIIDGGDRKTAAIESLKVLAFDLACMCLSVDGKTRLPAFLLHDSPREADLGLTIYHALFQLVRELEEATDQTHFQYIVTTTTKPPEDQRVKPWLRWTLHGSPGDERLLGRDL